MEQAALQRYFSSCGHLLTMKIPLQKCSDYNQPFRIAAVVYEKVFDSIQQWTRTKL